MTINYDTETLTFASNYEVSADANFTTMIASSESISNIIPAAGQGVATLYVRVKASGNILASAATTFTIPARPATPAVPTVSDYTDVSITVTNVSGQEYRLGSGTWQDSGAFSSLTPETQYTIETRVKATTTSFASLTNSINTTTKTSAGDGPQVGGIIVTDTTITLPYDETWEYSTDGTAWNDTREFTGLNPATQYTYYVRVKETTTAMASNPTIVTVYTAASAPAVGVGFNIDYAAETAAAQTNYEVSTDGSTWSAGPIDITPGGKLYVRVAAVENGAPTSAPTENTLAPRPAAPNAETVIGGNRQISGLDTTMEYLPPDGTDWVKIATDDLQNGVLSNLEPGTYQVRYAAVTGESPAFASESIEVTVTQPSSGSSTYPPIIEDTENGDVSVSPSRPRRGQTVTITPEPDEGYEVADVTVTDRNGNEVEVEDNGDGTWSFTQPSGRVTISVTFVCDGRTEHCPSYDYTDVDTSAWYHLAVDYAVENGLMVGTSATTFEPNATTTRAQLVTILWRLGGSPVVNYLMDYEDVAEDAWYAEAVRWAASEGIAAGYGDGRFGPDDPVTREQLAVILYRFAQAQGCDVSVGGDPDILSYEDFDQISEYAIPALQWTCGAGIIGGTGEHTLSPQGQTTRAQAAAMLQRFCQQYFGA